MLLYAEKKRAYHVKNKTTPIFANKLFKPCIVTEIKLFDQCNFVECFTNNVVFYLFKAFYTLFQQATERNLTISSKCKKRNNFFKVQY